MPLAWTKQSFLAALRRVNDNPDPFRQLADELRAGGVSETVLEGYLRDPLAVDIPMAAKQRLREAYAGWKKPARAKTVV